MPVPPARLADGLGVESLLVGRLWLALTCAPEQAACDALAQIGSPAPGRFSDQDSAAKVLLSAVRIGTQWRKG